MDSYTCILVMVLLSFPVLVFWKQLTSKVCITGTNTFISNVVSVIRLAAMKS